ncbi:tail needle knob protein [Aeromonas tecta]|uniref:tail needle knob protein n=1 Tax=Aeromonas tecta TaxID=324617 RepID=UPI00068142E9|nr:tail needle knob protein [Aeromonas tecta]
MPFGDNFIPGPVMPLPARKKSEVFWAALTGASLVANTDIDLVAWLNALVAPTSGTLAPFFNTTSNKLNVYNDNASVAFKLNLRGTWTGGNNRSMQLDFVGTNGNRLVQSRDSAVTVDDLTLATFFSIDKNGNIATNGTKPVIRSNGAPFTVTAVQIIAEQITTETVITPV